MKKSKFLLSTCCLMFFSLLLSIHAFAGGWCGWQNNGKLTVGDWVVQHNAYNQALDGDDCVEYTSSADWAKWSWNNVTQWSQFLLSKNGFCGMGYSLDNTAKMEISYNVNYTSKTGGQRVAIVSWAKNYDNCNWDIANTWELYIHEQSFNETDNYASWCTYKGESGTCSGSTYKMYDCGDGSIDGQWSIRCWRNSPRTSGTTDVQCLWDWWKSQYNWGTLYYYFTEVGVEAAPNSSGVFELTGHNMVRTAKSTNVDDVISYTSPDAVNPGQTITIPVTYSSTTNRDLHVVFQKDTDPWTTYVDVKVDVTAGNNQTANVSVTIPSTTPTGIDVYQWQVFLTTDGSNWDSRIDNIMKIDIDCNAASTNLLSNPGLESGTTSWAGNGATITSETTQKYAGLKSLKVGGRQGAWAGPKQNVTTTVKNKGKGTYYVEAFVKTVSANANMKIGIHLVNNSGTNSYPQINSKAVNSSGWTKLSGTINVTWTGTLTTAEFYLETDANADEFFIDECWLSKGTTKSAATATSLLSTNVSRFDMYPNPLAEGNLTFSFNNFSDHAFISIFDMQGKQVYKSGIIENNEMLQLSSGSLKSGLYVVKAKSDHNVISKKLVVK